MISEDEKLLIAGMLAGGVWGIIVTALLWAIA